MTAGKDSDQSEIDFEYSRQTYIALITKGNESLEEMMLLAKALEHPKAWEAAAAIIKNVADVNMRLVDLHKKRKDYLRSEKANDPDTDKAGTTNNNVFIGSTTDLQKMIAKMEIEEGESNVIDITARDKS